MCTLECLPLVIFNLCFAYECRIELITFRMSDHKLVISHVYTLGERIRNSLRKSLRVRSPCQNDLRFLHLLVLLDCDQVCKCLERMACRSLHTEYRLAGVLNELIDYLFVIVIFLALETCK